MPHTVMTMTSIPIIFAGSGMTNTSLRKHMKGYHGITLLPLPSPGERDVKGKFVNGLKRKSSSDTEIPRKQKKIGQCEYILHCKLL